MPRQKTTIFKFPLLNYGGSINLQSTFITAEAAKIAAIRDLKPINNENFPKTKLIIEE